MIKLAPLAIIGTAVLALSACGGADSDNATDSNGAGAGSADVSIADLEGTTFEASTPDALDSAKQSLVDGSPITVGFEGSNLSASAGCNGMGGKVAVPAIRAEMRQISNGRFRAGDDDKPGIGG